MAWPAVVGAIAGAALPAIGGIMGTNMNVKEARKSRKFAEQAAHESIQWRVADAKRAGLHPLAALGINPASGPSASMVGGPLARGMAESGQNIQRSMTAMSNNNTKAMNKLQEESLQQQVIGQKIQNAKALLEYSRPQNQAPGIQDNPDQLVNEIPSQITKAAPQNAGVQPGVKSLKDLFVDEHGTVTFELTQEASEPRESASGAKKIKTMIYDTAMIAKMATNPKLRARMQKLVTAELRRTGRLPNHKKVIWSHKRQEFMVVEKGVSKKPLIKFGNGYVEKRNKRESNKFWW